MEVACGIMINSNNKILLGLRPSNKENGGYWEFPGGKKEKEETIKECLQREWLEELNVHISIQEEIYSYLNGKYFCRFFIGNIIDEENLIMNIHDDIRFVNLDEIQYMNIFEGDYILLKYLTNRI